MSILFTIYTLLGLLFMLVAVAYIITANKMPKRYYKWCFVFPIHTFIVIISCILVRAVIFYIEHKERTRR